MESDYQPPAVSKKGVWSWIFYDWASQPFFTLILTFVFGPYFVAKLASTPEVGQTYWTGATAVSGIIIALCSPFLGAISDASGARKPWIAFFSIFFICGTMALWWAAPGNVGESGQNHTGLYIALVGFVLATIGAEFGIVFTNSMIPDLVPKSRIGWLSGTGWAMGYVGGLITLIVMIGLVIPGGADDLTMLGIPSIFGFVSNGFAGERFAGPFTALWYFVFVIPLFVFTPDVPRRMNLSDAVKKGIAQLIETIRLWREYTNAFVFLATSMIYRDALVGVFALGGIIGAAVFDWPITTVGIYGILLSVTGAIGAYIGGRVDDWLGPKWVIMAGIVVLSAGTVAILSIAKTHIFFFVPVAPPVPGGGLFASAAELTFLLVGLVVGLAIGSVQAASRSMLVRVVPHDKVAEFFGLFALSGKATSFMVPGAISVVTALSGDFRIGLTPILVAFIIGLIGMFFVHERT